MRSLTFGNIFNFLTGVGNKANPLFLFLVPMLSATTYNLEKLELLLNAAGFRVRYEKGNFKTGACLLQNSKMIIVNKFSNLESKIHSLIGLMQGIDIEPHVLNEKQQSFLHQIKQTKLEL